MGGHNGLTDHYFLDCRACRHPLGDQHPHRLLRSGRASPPPSTPAPYKFPSPPRAPLPPTLNTIGCLETRKQPHHASPRHGAGDKLLRTLNYWQGRGLRTRHCMGQPSERSASNQRANSEQTASRQRADSEPAPKASPSQRAASKQRANSEQTASRQRARTRGSFASPWRRRRRRQGLKVERRRSGFRSGENPTPENAEK